MTITPENIVDKLQSRLTVKDRQIIAEANDNAVLCLYFNKLLSEDTLDEDYLQLIDEVTDPKTAIYSDDIYSLIQLMANLVRENSSGAAKLKRVFVNFNVYKELGSKIDSASKMYIFGVEVLPCELLGEDEIIGLSSSKFTYIDHKYLICLGIINALPPR